MTSKRTKPTVTCAEEWTCALCNPPPAGLESAQQFIRHCSACHPELLSEDNNGKRTVKANCRLVLALDRYDSYSNVFEWKRADGRKIAEHCESGVRGPDDPMRAGELTAASGPSAMKSDPTAERPERKPDPLRITVRWDVEILSKNRLPRVHPGKRIRLTQEAHAAAGIAYILAGRPELDYPVDVRLIIRRSARMDDDGARTGAGPCRDRIFNRTKHGSGITPDDSDRWYRENEAIEWIIAPHWKHREEVEFVVTPRPGATERANGEVIDGA
jgi:hypothetical protein